MEVNVMTVLSIALPQCSI